MGLGKHSVESGDIVASAKVAHLEKRYGDSFTS